MGGLLRGLSEGMDAAQDRELRRQTLQVQQDHSKAQMKQMDAEDQLKQLQLHSLKKKLTAEEQLPVMQQDVTATNLGPNDLGPPPDIDRGKMVTFLQAAQHAGQDPDQLLSLMSMADPRIKAIHDSLKPETFTKLGEGDTVVSNKTGKQVAAGNPKTDKPISMAPGSSLVDPKTGETKLTLPPAMKTPPDFGDRLESAAQVYSMTVHGKPMTFSELMAVDPIKAGVVRQQAMVDEPVEIQKAKGEAMLPVKEKELLSPTEANELGLPFGTTKGEAKGTMAITPHQRESLAGYDTSRAIIADIRQYSEKVNKAGAGLKGRAEQAKKLWGAWTQSDPDAHMLQTKMGELASVARSLGEKGALANSDVARAAALIPSVMDTRDIAQQKIKDMESIINKGESNFRKSLGLDARAPVSSTKGQKPVPVTPPKEDPFAGITAPKGLTPQQEQVYKQAYADEKAKKQQQMKPKEKAKK